MTRPPHYSSEEKDILDALHRISCMPSVTDDDCCQAIATEALSESPVAEFIVGRAFLAAAEPERAQQWFDRAMKHGFDPKLLQRREAKLV